MTPELPKRLQDGASLCIVNLLFAGTRTIMTQRSFIVGIAGGSASGKTTLALALQEALTQAQSPRSTVIFHTDRYFTRDKSIGPTFISPSTGVEQFNCNHPDAVNTERLLGDLKACTEAVDAPAVVLVEGLMVLHEVR